MLPSTAEFFVYTAGSDEWANVIVGQLEKFLGRGQLFRRPLLTCERHCIRCDGGVYPVVKSLEKVYPDIHQALLSDYPDMPPLKKNGMTSAMRAQIVFIDDRVGNLPGDSAAVQQRQVVCPAYMALPRVPGYTIAVTGLSPEVLTRSDVIDFLRRHVDAPPQKPVTASVAASSAGTSSDTFFSHALDTLKTALKTHTIGRRRQGHVPLQNDTLRAMARPGKTANTAKVVQVDKASRASKAFKTFKPRKAAPA